MALLVISDTEIDTFGNGEPLLVAVESFSLTKVETSLRSGIITVHISDCPHVYSILFDVLMRNILGCKLYK
jgi:hypothetical protein